MKRILMVAVALLFIGNTQSMQPGASQTKAQMVQLRIFQAFDDTTTLADYIKQQSLITDPAISSVELLEIALGFAGQYKRLQENLLATNENDDVRGKKAHLENGIIMATAGLYFCSRLPIAYYTESSSKMRWPFFPASRFITAIGYDSGLLRKFVFACELTCVLVGVGFLFEAKNLLHKACYQKQILEKRIVHITAIIDYLQTEIAQTKK